MAKAAGIVVGVIAVVLIAGLVITRHSSPAPLPAASTTAGHTGALTPDAPSVTTGSSVTSNATSALVTGSVTPNGATARYWYEYGITDAASLHTPKQPIGSGYAPREAPALIPGLSLGTTYYFRLVAENRFGSTTGSEFTFTAAKGPATKGGIPVVATAPASGISPTAATVSGSVNPNGSITRYWFEYGTTAEFGSSTDSVSLPAGQAKVPVSSALSDIASDTTYYFRLDAQNDFGTTAGPVLSFKTGGVAVARLPVVASEQAVNVATTTATLRGSIEPNGTRTTYWFEYSADPNLGAVLLRSTPRIALATTTGHVGIEVDVASLVSSTMYYFRLAAQNAAGTVRSAPLSFRAK